MQLEQFSLERMQSTWENLVAINLSESGVQPLSPRELLGDDKVALGALLDQRLGYSQSNGTRGLRSAIAARYPGATIDHVQVTNGGSEANFVATWRLVVPGDEVIVLVPNYLQIWGLARAFGATAHEWPLIDDPHQGRWRPDLDALDRLVSAKTRLIAICTPNNPTGARLTADELDQIAAIAARHGTWVLSDEIYRGAEVDGIETPSMWGRYDRVLVTSGLSKAYGLPGLRIGWVVAPPPLIESLWSYHDYTTIAPSPLSDRLATVALAPDTRERLIARTRGILRANLPLVEAWLHDHPGGFSWTRPEAGAIVYVRYHYRVNSTTLVTRLRETRSVLIVPGDHFGMDGYLRLGYGESPEHVRAGLAHLHDLLATLPHDERIAPLSS
jgi:aspartate/methionine/tyrosine aminotransferase